MSALRNCSPSASNSRKARPPDQLGARYTVANLPSRLCLSFSRVNDRITPRRRRGSYLARAQQIALVYEVVRPICEVLELRHIKQKGDVRSSLARKIAPTDH